MGERSDANPALRFLSKISDDQMVVFFLFMTLSLGIFGEDRENEEDVLETTGTEETKETTAELGYHFFLCRLCYLCCPHLPQRNLINQRTNLLS